MMFLRAVVDPWFVVASRQCSGWTPRLQVLSAHRLLAGTITLVVVHVTYQCWCILPSWGQNSRICSCCSSSSFFWYAALRPVSDGWACYLSGFVFIVLFAGRPRYAHVHGTLSRGVGEKCVHSRRHLVRGRLERPIARIYIYIYIYGCRTSPPPVRM